MCDIAPLGISVARAAGIPSVLVENFTWDWIYAGYLHEDRRLSQYADYLGSLFDRVDYRIQTEPVSRCHSDAFTTSPVSRAVRTPPGAVRLQLGVPEGKRLVLLTMGGFSSEYRCRELLATRPEVYFVVPGGQREGVPTSDLQSPNVISLPHRSSFFHPDLVNASDVVIGKVGYSTVAEVYWSGCAFGYVPRPRFRESEVLEEFAQREVPCLAVAADEFDSGRWIDRLPDLLALSRRVRRGTNGAEQVAEFVSDLLTG
jgi:UDP-N-acetylglucosamine:LPS N-acetylglucosamine transferase